MRTKDEFMAMVLIAERTEQMGLPSTSRLSLLMDLENVHEQFNLDLNGLLNADDSNFIHDMIGIYKHFDRPTLTMKDGFLPRYARG